MEAISVKVLPKKLDEEVARNMVEDFGGVITQLTTDQAKYINVKVEGPYEFCSQVQTPSASCRGLFNSLFFDLHAGEAVHPHALDRFAPGDDFEPVALAVLVVQNAGPDASPGAVLDFLIAGGEHVPNSDLMVWAILLHWGPTGLDKPGPRFAEGTVLDFRQTLQGAAGIGLPKSQRAEKQKAGESQGVWAHGLVLFVVSFCIQGTARMSQDVSESVIRAAFCPSMFRTCSGLVFSMKVGRELTLKTTAFRAL